MKQYPRLNHHHEHQNLSTISAPHSKLNPTQPSVDAQNSDLHPNYKIDKSMLVSSHMSVEVATEYNRFYVNPIVFFSVERAHRLQQVHLMNTFMFTSGNNWPYLSVLSKIKI
jgi:hypothetical protein